MAVQYIVAYSLIKAECIDTLCESGQVLIEVMLVNGGWRSGCDMNYPHMRVKLYDLRCVFIGPASEDIDCSLGAPQFACKFVYIDIHTASIPRSPFTTPLLPVHTDPNTRIT